MNIAPVAYRYARSLMELAQEKGVLAGVHEDMRLVAATCAGSRDLLVLLKEARDIRDKEIAEAKGKAKAEADALLARARTDNQNEKNAAITEMKNQVAELSILVAERILRDKLESSAAQQSLVDKVMAEAETRKS